MLIENATPAAPEAATTEVEQITATPQIEGTETSEASNETQAEKTFTQDELNEIVQKQKAKAEARAERRATQAYKEALETVTRQSQPTKSTEPTREQFASDAEWIDATVERKLAEREANSASQNIAKTTENLYAQAEKIQGFDREAFDELPLTKHMAGPLVESDVAPKLMAYMVANPEEVERISKLSPARQAAEIGKLETKLETTAKKSPLPAPIVPIGSKGVSMPSLQSASTDEYTALRKAQGAIWAR